MAETAGVGGDRRGDGLVRGDWVAWVLARGRRCRNEEESA